MAKRSFQRSRGILRDEYTNPEGRRHVEETTASLVGETLSDADRAQGLADVFSGDAGAQFRGVHRLADDRSSEYLESLLAALATGSSAAPNALLQFLDDKRVRPALVAATRRAPAADLANFAQAVALAGGHSAIAVLRDRLAELLNSPHTFEDDPFFNAVTGSLVTVAGGLLRLGADEEQAAAALARVVREHPCAFNRRSAAYEACEALEQPHSPEATRALESILAEQLVTDDPEMFTTVAPTLVKTREGQVLGRCRELLGHASSEIRTGASFALQKMKTPKANALLLEHLHREPWLRAAAQIAAHLRTDAPASLRTAIARKTLADDSPSLRRGGVALLRDLDPEIARSLAEEALVDEPDPLVRRGLEELLSR